MPIRIRLTVAFAALAAVALGTIGALVYVRFESQAHSTIDDALRSRAATLQSTSASGTGARRGTQLDADEAFAQLLGVDGHVIDGRSALGGTPLLPAGDVASVTEPRFRTTVIGRPEEPLRSRLFIVPNGDGTVLVVGSSLERLDDDLARLRQLLFLGGPIGVTAVTVAAWLLAGAALRPVERLRRDTASISAGEPDRRLLVPATRDEIARLAATLNDLLDRLAEARQQERRFVDDASHELRTPIGILRTELEVALRHPRSVTELEAVVRSAHAEAERLSRLTEDLLVLARADHGRLPLRLTTVRLDEVLAPIHNAHPDLTAEVDDLAVRADPDRLRQALDNLVDNAYRHGAPPVTVRAWPDGDSVTIGVRDHGPGLPAAVGQSAFDRFRRGDHARGRDTGGTGLGLAIVSAIARAHDAQVVAVDPDGNGAEIRLRLPAAET